MSDFTDPLFLTKLKNKTKFYQMNALNNKEFKPIPQLVPNVFSAIGSTLLAGREKGGKSFMMMDLLLGVSHSGMFMGHSMEPFAGDVLYLALEDNEQRMGLRGQKLGYATFNNQMTILHQAGRIGDEVSCISQIEYWHRLVKNKGRIPRAVVVDTLNFVRPIVGKGQNPYQNDCNDVKQLTEAAHNWGVALFLVHHLNKKDATNPNDKISGTTGLPASVDNVVVVWEKHDQTILSVKSRDMDSGTYDVSFDKDSCKWQYLGQHNFDEDRQSEKTEKILEFLTLSGPSSPRDIADGCGINRASIYTYLNRLNGKIEKSSHGIYGVKLTTVN